MALARARAQNETKQKVGCCRNGGLAAGEGAAEEVSDALDKAWAITHCIGHSGQLHCGLESVQRRRARDFGRTSRVTAERRGSAKADRAPDEMRKRETVCVSRVIEGSP